MRLSKRGRAVLPVTYLYRAPELEGAARGALFAAQARYPAGPRLVN